MSIPHVGSRQPERASWSHEHLKHALALALDSTIDALSAAACGSTISSSNLVLSVPTFQESAMN